MNVSRARAVAVAAALSALLVDGNAAAQENEGFALNRFDVSERGSDWFVGESLDFRQGKRLAIGIVADWAHEPLIVLDENDEQVETLVGTQVFAHAGASYLITDRFRVAANFPLAVVNDGNTAQAAGATFSSSDGATDGDLRLGVDARLFGEYATSATGAFGVQVHLPTGSRDAFTGDEKVRVVPRFMLAGESGSFAYAARVGFMFRALNDNFAGEPFGSELTYALAAGLRAVDGKLLVGPELYGSTVVSDSGDGAFGSATTPLEVILGGHFRVSPDWRVGAGVGPGLTPAFGTPAVRAVASVTWFPEPKADEPAPPPPPADRDGDGIVDGDDACPDEAGVPSDDKSKHGCPPPSDRDGDRIPDDVDACPDVPGVASTDPKRDGCPPDGDGDGIVDADDACPTEPGPASADPAKNGCPAPKDTDGDGIIDPDDACPSQAGPADPDPKKNGCPKAKIEGKEIKILERVEFETNKAIIRPVSEGVLNAVRAILEKHPEIKKVSVEGHTDNRGNRAYNMKLSRGRAKAVVEWLVGRGIERGRFQSKGFGPTKPIAPNDTDEGRQKNRRVEFHIVSGKVTPAAEPAGAASPAPEKAKPPAPSKAAKPPAPAKPPASKKADDRPAPIDRRH